MFSRTLENMKNRLKEKLQNNVLVKPLYRKFKNGNRIKPKLLISVDSTFKLDGNEISVKRNIVNDNGIIKRKNNLSKENVIFLCGSDEDCNKGRLFEKIMRKYEHNGVRKGDKMLSSKENRKPNSEVEGIEDKTSKFVQANHPIAVIQKVSITIYE